MNQAAQNFISYLNEKGVRHTVDEITDNTVVAVGYTLENTSAKASIFFSDDNKHIAMRCFDVVKAPKDKFANLIICCNKANLEYRWAKFVINDDMEVSAQLDAIINEDDSAEVYELMIRILDIVDKTYPDFMKAIWA